MRWLKLGFVALLAFAAVAFTIQNGERTSDLSLNLWLVGTRTRGEVAVPWLMWASFGVGFGLASLWGLARVAALSRRVRKLETEAALAGSGPQREGWT